MKTIQNSFITIFGVCVLSALSKVDIATCAETRNFEVSKENNQKAPLVLARKEEDLVIYKKDIIIRSDELKAESKKEVEEFKPIEKPVSKKQETPDLDIVDKYLREGKKYEARNILSDFFINKKIPGKQKEIKELLDKLNEELIFSPAPSPDATTYTVQPGDILSRIAKQFNTNYELIMKINGKASARLNIGEQLKILTGKTKIFISKSDFTLTLMLNDHYVRQYRIATGKNDKTPVGTFEVKNKMKEPVWYSPDGGVFPYGHKENILGTRWIGFKDKPNLSGYGIHGTTQPETIGTASSNGCIRMINGDVEELYDFVTANTEIIIQT
ncbi:MAG: LysM peptidoglycan-binding domain-containing protein [Candidatus Brocadia sp.]|nr:LysM peptidoglycan-binding domain-containing protein [Candidatus Brocadia sp.]